MEAAKDYVETALRLFRWILERKRASIAKSAVGAGENGADGGNAMETDEAPAAAAGTGGEVAKPEAKSKSKGKAKDDEKDPTREIDEKKIMEVIAVCEKVVEGVPERLENAQVICWGVHHHSSHTLYDFKQSLSTPFLAQDLCLFVSLNNS